MLSWLRELNEKPTPSFQTGCDCPGEEIMFAVTFIGKPMKSTCEVSMVPAVGDDPISLYDQSGSDFWLNMARLAPVKAPPPVVWK